MNNSRFTQREELANSVSHGTGALLSAVGLIILVISAVKSGSVRHIVSFSVFGATLTILYMSSTLNHALKKGKWKDFFHNFDQIAIFLLIAGTYTPLALVGLKHDWGWTMFGAQWGFALSGILIKLFVPNKFEKGVNVFYIIAYIVMGWMLLFFLTPILRNIPATGIWLIFIGGFFYTIGTLFFKVIKFPYAHLIWHLFVIAGSIFHWLAIVLFVLPLNL